MKRGFEAGLFILAVCIFIISIVYFASAEENDTMVIEAQILTGFEGGNESIISIEVPDYFFMGNVTAGKLSDEQNISIKNNGNVKIKISAELVNQNDNIFTNLLMRESSSKYMPIDKFNMNISSAKKNVYMKLNLTDVEGIENTFIAQNQIRFIATEA